VVQRSKERPFFDLKPALAAIVLGESYPHEDVIVLRHRLELANLAGLPVHQLRWHSGEPFAYVDHQSLGMTNVATP
jgi:hypothetical protein